MVTNALQKYSWQILHGIEIAKFRAVKLFSYTVRDKTGQLHLATHFIGKKPCVCAWFI